VATTWAAGVTAAAGTSLTQPFLQVRFRHLNSLLRRHSEFPYRAGAQCKVFAPDASRRTWVLFSEPISGLLLSQPIPIGGLLIRYINNDLIGRRPTLWCRSFGASCIPAIAALSGISPSFPGVIPVHRTSYPRVTEPSAGLLPPPKKREHPRLTWLSRTLIAVASGRINQCYVAGLFPHTRSELNAQPNMLARQNWVKPMSDTTFTDRCVPIFASM
jgi:hypothetical protein